MKSFQSGRLAAVAIIAATILGATPAAQAAVSGDFNVTVSVSSLCTLTTVGTPSLDFGTYTAFGSASIPAPTAQLTFDCTRGLTAPTMALDTTNGTSTATGAVGGAAATGDGVLPVVGLNYHLSVAGSKTGTGVAPTTAFGDIGTADTYTFTVTGSMPNGQAGTCTTGTCGPDTQLRTLTVTY